MDMIDVIFRVTIKGDAWQRPPKSSRGLLHSRRPEKQIRRCKPYSRRDSTNKKAHLSVSPSRPCLGGANPNRLITLKIQLHHDRVWLRPVFRTLGLHAANAHRSGAVTRQDLLSSMACTLDSARSACCSTWAAYCSAKVARCSV